MDRIGFIGGGAMGEAIIRGLIARGMDPSHITVYDMNRQRLKQLSSMLGIQTVLESKEILFHCNTLILAVKPQNLSEAVAGFSADFTRDKLLISILAGVATAAIEKLLPEGSRVVRVMPNTPALIGEGTAVLAGGINASDEDMAVSRAIFEAVGRVSVLPENLLNAVTGLSGSAPAYVYLFIEALADGGVLAGLPRNVALQLAIDTVRGSARMAEETQKHPGQLKDMVTSPAGTTIYGMLQLEKSGVRGAIMEAVLAAAKRAQEL